MARNRLVMFRYNSFRIVLFLFNLWKKNISFGSFEDSLSYS